MKHRPIRTGLLSFGMSGKVFHAPFLSIHKGFELSAVVERSVQNANQIYPDIRSYRSVEELLEDDGIELVVVNTPNATHAEYALKALRAGKHVLMEKPFAIGVKQAIRVFSEAWEQRRLVLPYQNRRYDTDLQSVMGVVESGRLGRLVEVHIRFDRYRSTIGPKVAKETPVPGSGLMYDIFPHLLDAALYLFGEPLKWTKTLGCFRDNTQVDDYAHIHLLYPDDVQVFLTASLLVADPQPAFVLHGTKGSFVKYRADVQEKQLLEGMLPSDPRYGCEAPGKAGVMTLIGNDGSRTQETITSVRSSYLNVFEQVYQAVREGKTYSVTEQQILRQLEILES